MKKSVYQIWNIEAGTNGKPFALCEEDYKNWTAGKYLLHEKIGDNSPLPCNTCGL